MQAVLIILLVLVAIAIITLVLLQHGKGADIGASFGSGASSTVFGSQGSASFLVKLTFGLAAVFFILLIVLTRLSSQNLAVTPSIEAPSTSTSTSQPVNRNSVPAVPTSNYK